MKQIKTSGNFYLKSQEAVGKIIDNYRIKKGIGVSDFAFSLGISRQAYNAIKTGKVYPSHTTRTMLQKRKEYKDFKMEKIY